MARKLSSYIAQAQEINLNNIRSEFKPVGYNPKSKADRLAYRNNLETYVKGLSKNLYDRTTRLTKTYKGKESHNPYLLSKKEGNKNPVVSRINAKQASKMTIRDLEAKARELTAKARNKTMSVTQAKQFEKEFEEKTGMKFDELTTQDWANIKDMRTSGFESGDGETVAEIYIKNGKQKILKEDYDKKQAEQLTDKNVEDIKTKFESNDFLDDDGWSYDDTEWME